MLQRWRTDGNTVSDLASPAFEPHTYHSIDERVTARQTGRRGKGNYSTINYKLRSRKYGFCLVLIVLVKQKAK